MNDLLLQFEKRLSDLQIGFEQMNKNLCVQDGAIQECIRSIEIIKRIEIIKGGGQCGKESA